MKRRQATQRLFFEPYILRKLASTQLSPNRGTAPPAHLSRKPYEARLAKYHTAVTAVVGSFWRSTGPVQYYGQPIRTLPLLFGEKYSIISRYGVATANQRPPLLCHRARLIFTEQPLNEDTAASSVPLVIHW